jgi:ketosteroid isomerase-like protein
MSEESTTPDLVELVRLLAEALDCRDFDAVASFFAPDVFYRGAEIGTFEGRAAVRDLLEDMLKPYEEVHVEIEEVIDLGIGVTFLVYVLKGRPVGSIAEVRLRFASVVIWSEGLIERQTNYMNIDEGRAAAERLAEERG